MTTPNDPNQPNYDAYRYPETPNQTPGQTPGQTPPQDNYGGYQSTYDAPPAGNWAVDAARNGVAPWALGVSILALVMTVSIFLTAFAAPVALIALILAIVALVKSRKITGPYARKGMSITALVLSIIALVLSVLFWVVITVFLSESGVMDCFTLTDPAAQQACVDQALNDLSNA